MDHQDKNSSKPAQRIASMSTSKGNPCNISNLHKLLQTEEQVQKSPRVPPAELSKTHQAKTPKMASQAFSSEPVDPRPVRYQQKLRFETPNNDLQVEPAPNNSKPQSVASSTSKRKPSIKEPTRAKSAVSAAQKSSSTCTPPQERPMEFHRDEVSKVLRISRPSSSSKPKPLDKSAKPPMRPYEGRVIRGSRSGTIGFPQAVPEMPQKTETEQRRTEEEEEKRKIASVIAKFFITQ